MRLHLTLNLHNPHHLLACKQTPVVDKFVAPVGMAVRVDGGFGDKPMVKGGEDGGVVDGAGEVGNF